MELKKLFRVVIPIAIVALLGGCNVVDEFSSDKKEEAREKIKKKFSGVITDLQTLKINDVTFDRENAKIYVNGKEVDYSDLKLGMVVTVTGTETGTKREAISIEYDQQLQGVVVSNSFGVDGTLDIMGQTVYVNSDTVIDSDNGTVVDINSVPPDYIVEVSGYASGNGEFWATRLEFKLASADDEDWEVEGEIQSSYEGGFMIGTLNIVYDTTKFSQLMPQLVDGAYVEVESYNDDLTDGELTADEIEIKHSSGKTFDYDEDDQELEIEGIVTAIVSETEVEINGTTVLLDQLNSTVNLSVGDKVEAEIEVDDSGNFYAIELEIEDDDAQDDNDEDDDEDSDDDDDDSDS